MSKINLKSCAFYLKTFLMIYKRTSKIVFFWDEIKNISYRSGYSLPLGLFNISMLETQ